MLPALADLPKFVTYQLFQNKSNFLLSVDAIEPCIQMIDFWGYNNFLSTLLSIKYDTTNFLLAESGF